MVYQLPKKVEEVVPVRHECQVIPLRPAERPGRGARSSSCTPPSQPATTRLGDRGEGRMSHQETKTVGIVGLGYVGLPLAVEFAEAGQRVICVDVNVGRVAADPPRRVLHRGHPERAPAGGRGSDRGHHARRAPRARRRDHRLRPDPAHGEPRARPRAADRRRQRALGRPAARPADRARVDDLPGHHARARAAAARGVRSDRRPRLPPRVLARARRPGPHGPHAAQHAEDHRRPHARLPRSRGGALRRSSATSSCRSPPPRWRR